MNWMRSQGISGLIVVLLAANTVLLGVVLYRQQGLTAAVAELKGASKSTGSNRGTGLGGVQSELQSIRSDIKDIDYTLSTAVDDMRDDVRDIWEKLNRL